MRIKKFVGGSLQDVTNQMRRELGQDAIILDTRAVRKNGVLHFLSKPQFEITAALDDQVIFGKKSPQNPFSATSSGRDSLSGKGTGLTQETLEGLERIAQDFNRKSAEMEKRNIETKRFAETASYVQIKADIEEVKEGLKEIVDHLKYARMPALPIHLKRAYSRLLKNNVEEKIAADLVQSIYAKLSDDEYEQEPLIEKRVVDALAAEIKTAKPAKSSGKRARVIALVGPTGVGKTTTIAKLAAIHKMLDHKDVALISADTYRIGAIEQLRTFAAIADIPMEVVYSSSEMGVALRKHREKDIILIDTVGRSQRSKKEIGEIRRFVDAAEPDETHLVVNVSSSPATLLEVMDRFRNVRPNRILFSKLDEAATLGCIISVSRQHDIPISYCTTGQTVPDDIIAVDAPTLASMVYKGVIPNA